MTATSFRPGQIVTIRDYADPRHHDPRSGDTAEVTGTYNGLISVIRNGFPETYVPARLD